MENWSNEINWEQGGNGEEPPTGLAQSRRKGIASSDQRVKNSPGKYSIVPISPLILMKLFRLYFGVLLNR